MPGAFLMTFTVHSPKAPAWYVLETRNHFEKLIVQHIEEQAQLNAYLPLETHRRRIGRNRGQDRISLPLLPGLLFVEFHHDDDGGLVGLDKVRKLAGVKGLIGVAGEPRPIPTWWLNVIRRGEALGAFDYGARGVPNYKAGRAVRVIEGPFADWFGEFICKTKDGRIKVLLEALNGAPPKRVKLEIDSIEPVVPDQPLDIWSLSSDDAA